jgi:hypothetical protein
MIDRTLRVFRNFQEAEEADRYFYRSLTPDERLKIWFELCRFDRLDEPEHRLQRVYRIAPLGGR